MTATLKVLLPNLLKQILDILKRSFHFLGKSSELQEQTSVVLLLCKATRTAGREGISSENFGKNSLWHHHPAPRLGHGPLESRDNTEQLGQHKDEIFSFWTTVGALPVIGLFSRAGRLQYWWVLWENSKKSFKNQFSVKITKKIRISGICLGNFVYRILSEDAKNFVKNLWKIESNTRRSDFSLVFERAR